MLYTIIDRINGEAFQADTSDREEIRENLLELFGGGDGDDGEITQAITALAEGIGNRAPIDELEAFLNLRVEPYEDEEPDLPEWPADSYYNKILSPEQALAMTRLGKEGALTASGETGQDTTLVRHAYIKRELGARGLRRAQAATDRKELKEIFIEAWQTAWTRWDSEHNGLESGSRMSGTVLKAVREIMGLTQEELGQQLGGVQPRTIRGWENGDRSYTPPTEALTSEVWGLLRAWTAEVTSAVKAAPAPQGVPLLPAETDLAIIKAAILLTAGRIGTQPAVRTRRGTFDQ